MSSGVWVEIIRSDLTSVGQFNEPILEIRSDEFTFQTYEDSSSPHQVSL
jgi:hypothetical protein